MPKRITKIYVDMDGVLANFEKRWKELFGDTKYNNSNFEIFIRNQEFAVLDAMSDAQNLIQYLNHRWSHVPIEILSSTANEEDSQSISNQKRMWLQKHNITWKENFVPGKRYKKQYAESGAVLIDDDKKNIQDWNDAGGIGILHKDALTTIALLKLYV